MKLHHIGYIVSNINDFESKMIFENKINDVVDPVQNARLTLYNNYSDTLIELIQPLNENSYTWDSLKKHGNHFAHLCYLIMDIEELNSIILKYRLIQILNPVPAILFNNKLVSFCFNRNKEILEFILEC